MNRPPRPATFADRLGDAIGFVETLPERVTQSLMETAAELALGTTWRGRILAFLALLILLALPHWAGRPLMLGMIGLLWLAYVGQAWNLLSGFAGQLSLGHALFVGGGAWLGATLLLKAGIGPWLGLGPVVLAVALAGGALGWLSLRAGLAGTGFALLTLIAAEAGHIAAKAGSSGAVIPAPAMLPEAHGEPVAAYYLILAMTLTALLLSRLLLRSRLGHHWLAVRDDPVTAAASGIDVFRTRLSALVISAALTAPAGLFLVFSGAGLDADRLFSANLSMEIMLTAVIGGLGTLFGPVVGALALVPLDQFLTWAGNRGAHPLPGLVPFGYGLVLIAMVTLRPTGLWPWLAQRLSLVPPPSASDRDDRP